jgi:hypothetical protein
MSIANYELIKQNTEAHTYIKGSTYKGLLEYFLSRRKSTFCSHPAQTTSWFTKYLVHLATLDLLHVIVC